MVLTDTLKKGLIGIYAKEIVLVTDFMIRLKMGKRIHLCEYEADALTDGLNKLFERVLKFQESNTVKDKRLIRSSLKRHYC